MAKENSTDPPSEEVQGAGLMKEGHKQEEPNGSRSKAPQAPAFQIICLVSMSNIFHPQEKADIITLS